MLPFLLYLVTALLTGRIVGPFMYAALWPAGVLGPVLLLMAAFVSLSNSRSAAWFALAGAGGTWLALLLILRGTPPHELIRAVIATELLLFATTAYCCVAAISKWRPREGIGAWVFPQRAGAIGKIIAGFSAALIIGVMAAAILFAPRSVRIRKEMTWECAPDQYKAWAPEAQPVRFRYVENPNCEEVIAGRGLCDQLKVAGKKTVIVDFEAWGNRPQGLLGFHEVSVDGKPIINVGGWGSSGCGGYSPHPLRKAFNPN